MKYQKIKAILLAATMTQIFSWTVWGNNSIVENEEKQVETNLALASPSDATDRKDNVNLDESVYEVKKVTPPKADSVNSDFKYEVVGDSIKITKYIGNSPDVTIPTQIDNKPVKIIGERSFLMNDQLRSVYIPEGVETIEGGYYAGAFHACRNLATVNLPSTLISIGDFTFSGCKINTIQLPDNLESLGSYAFEGCELSSITIPDGISSIRGGVFHNCTNLKEVNLPASMTSIPGGLFENCTNLKEVILPYSITSIGNNAFAGCESITSIVLPENVNEIGIGAFEGSGLKALIISYKVTKIEPQTFMNCYNLADITIPDSISSIGSEAFRNCTSLETITIPDSVKILEYAADDLDLDPESGGGEGYFMGPFYRCDSLKTINGGNGLTNIGKTSFYVSKSNPTLTNLNTTNDLFKNYDWNKDNRYLDGTIPPSNESNTSGGGSSSSGGGGSSSGGSPKARITQSQSDTMTGSWLKDYNGWWFSKSNGDYARNEWGKVNNNWYHFDSNGYMQKGWQLIDNSWYYLEQTGAYERSMKAGWLFDSTYNNWFFFSETGAMRTGWIYDTTSKKWYYCDKDGAMLTDTWVDNYYISGGGEWVENS